MTPEDLFEDQFIRKWANKLESMHQDSKEFYSSLLGFMIKFDSNCFLKCLELLCQ